MDVSQKVGHWKFEILLVEAEFYIKPSTVKEKYPCAHASNPYPPYDQLILAQPSYNSLHFRVGKFKKFPVSVGKS